MQHFTRNMWHFFLVFLTFIWVLICIWFAMICNVVWKVLTGDAAEDTRSDDEEESEETEEEIPYVTLHGFDIKRAALMLTAFSLLDDAGSKRRASVRRRRLPKAARRANAGSLRASLFNTA